MPENTQAIGIRGSVNSTGIGKASCRSLCARAMPVATSYSSRLRGRWRAGGQPPDRRSTVSPSSEVKKRQGPGWATSDGLVTPGRNASSPFIKVARATPDSKIKAVAEAAMTSRRLRDAAKKSSAFNFPKLQRRPRKHLPMAAIYFAKDAPENRLHCFRIENCLVDIEHGQRKSGHVSRLQS
jgi:hypothetical protein